MYTYKVKLCEGYYSCEPDEQGDGGDYDYGYYIANNFSIAPQLNIINYSDRSRVSWIINNEASSNPVYALFLCSGLQFSPESCRAIKNSAANGLDTGTISIDGNVMYTYDFLKNDIILFCNEQK